MPALEASPMEEGLGLFFNGFFVTRHNKFESLQHIHDITKKFN